MNNLSIRSPKVLAILAIVSLSFLYLVEYDPNFYKAQQYAMEFNFMQDKESSTSHALKVDTIIDSELSEKRYNLVQVGGMLLFLIITIAGITIAENRRNALGKSKTMLTQV